ncbi:MAG: HAMP domain-containing protein [Ideonella sp.]|nr:HAMP domain-containing protein [Ideonella sp.]MCC7456433.1 HAMP domain-containing protein [Nitrospira sp.]
MPHSVDPTRGVAAVPTGTIGGAAERWWARADPRRHLAAAIGWAVLALVALASLVAASLAAATAERRAKADTQGLIAQFAVQIHDGLGMNLQTRLSILRATAAQITASRDRGNAALRRHLEAVQAQFPEFAWVGVADAEGRVIAATGGEFEGRDVSGRAWFQQGRHSALLSGVLDAVPDRLLPPDGRPLRWIDAAAPIGDGRERGVGVIGARLSYAWIEQLQHQLLGALDTQRNLQLIVAGSDGVVASGLPAWRGRPLAQLDLGEAGRYLVGRHGGRGGQGLDWTVVVRQPADAALAAAHDTRRWVFLVVLLAGITAALASVAATRALTRRLALLAEGAHAVRSGERAELATPAGDDEIGRIGAALAELVRHLQREKQALATLNAELDQRVADRSARIERLAAESRRAAVTRERLRLARDLHDTLAHSLMALLTQIRLVRKLRPRMAEAELEAELAQAEAVAANGLAEARAAIAQVRHNSVQDVGLGAALGELLQRFHERSGVQAELHADPAAAAMADDRAETVFRIVEEALHNVERHAMARHVHVALRELQAGADARRRVTVRDDGRGFDPGAPRPGHYGLIGIREQAALIGAALAIDSTPGNGTCVALEFAA